MNQDQFVARRRAQWQELSEILQEMQRRGPRRLSLEQAQRLGSLYRRTASDLAYARTYFPGTQAVDYLNQLVAQAHTLVYAEEPQRMKALARFFWHDVPRTIRAHWRHLALSAALMLVGGLVGFLAVLHDPNLAEALVPEQVLSTMVSPQDRYNMPVQFRGAIGTAIMLNNIKVGVLAFGLGVTLAIGTGLVLFYNGVIIGAVVAQSVLLGDTYSLWAFLLTHGALELMAIALCGAAGFAIGWTIVHPGELPRGEAVARGARQDVTMVMGSLLFFVVAAALESFVTPRLDISDAGKYLIALGTGTAGLAYWLLPGRGAAVTDAPAP